MNTVQPMQISKPGIRRSLLLAFGVLPAVLLLLGGCAVTPKPLTETDIQNRVAADKEVMFADQEAVTGPISLEEAMARALKYNLDLRLKMMESALSSSQADLSKYDMLPNLVASAGYVSRSNESGGTSVSLSTGEVSLESSTSQERERQLARAEFSWNILDFGVSYYRARQQADHYLIAEENRRKVVQTLLQDVRSAYWRAMEAQRLARLADQLDGRIRTALERSRASETQGLVPPREALAYQRLMLDAVSLINARRQELDLARRELSALMNTPPDMAFTLVERDEAPLLAVRPDLAELEDLALHNRPELREEDYKARISTSETRRMLLAMLPGLGISAGPNYDSNTYLENSSWFEANLQASWNVLRLLALPSLLNAREAQVTTDEARRLALSMAIITQVRVATGRYQLALENLEISRESSAVDQRIASFARAGASTKSDTELELIRAEVKALNSAYQQASSYAAAQAAAARLHNSVGLDALPGEQTLALSVRELAAQLATLSTTADPAVFSGTPVQAKALPPVRLELRWPNKADIPGIDTRMVHEAVQAILERNRVQVLGPDEKGAKVTMTLRLEDEKDTIRKARWQLDLSRQDGSPAGQGEYASALPAALDSATMSAFAEAAMVAHLQKLETLDEQP